MADKQQLRFAISGTSRAGKDTFAEILKAKLVEKGYARATSHAFADPIKQVYKMFFSHVDTSEKPRDAYVAIGNTFRGISSDVWIYPLIADIKRSWEEGNSVIVTDARYENEAEVLASRGFIIIKVDADPYIRKARAEALGEHLDLDNEGDMEVGFIKEDLLILNNGESDFQSLPKFAEIAIKEALKLAEL